MCHRHLQRIDAVIAEYDKKLADAKAESEKNLAESIAEVKAEAEKKLAEADRRLVALEVLMKSPEK